MRWPPDRSPAGVPAKALTPRQREIAALVAEGATNRTIAERLGVELDAVNTDVALLLWVLGLTRRAQVSVWAARQGLYPPHIPSRRTESEWSCRGGVQRD